VIYRFFWYPVRAYFLWFLGARVEGLSHLPASGPVILCANHRSWLDPPLVGGAVPRRVHFMAKEELFRYPLFGPFLRLLGAFPVRRHTADRGALRSAVRVLRRGGVVGMFLEGTRSRTGRLGPARPGAVWLAVTTGAPVVPVAISGSYRRGGGLVVRLGPPVDMSAYRGQRLRGAELETLANEVIMAAIARALGEGRGAAAG
jgi:1-acyl-sn-glycerol-3-phosphate acyltransferase